jgi:hypothetical protein
MQQDVGIPDTLQFFVQALWFALVEVAELIVAGKLEADNDPHEEDDDVPNMSND